MSVSPFPIPREIAQFIPRGMTETTLDDFRIYSGKLVLISIELTLKANFGAEKGHALFEAVFDKATMPNPKLAGGKYSSAALSKAETRLRRGFGLPVRCPKNARPKPKKKTEII